MRWALLLVLVATAASRDVCRYTVRLVGPDEKSEPTLARDLSTDIIDDQVRGYPDRQKALAEGLLSILVNAVCKINERHNHFIYQTSENTQLKVDSFVSNQVYTELKNGNQNYIHKGNTRYLHIDINITNWVVGESFLNVASFTRGFAPDTLMRKQDPHKVLDGLNLQFQAYAQQNIPYSDETPKPGTPFGMPEKWNCIFSSEAEDLDYHLESSGTACLVRSKPLQDIWQTICLAENWGTCQYPSVEPTIPALENIGDGEMLVFTKLHEDTITRLSWVQNNLKYLMTVFSEREGNVVTAPERTGPRRISRADF